MLELRLTVHQPRRKTSCCPASPKGPPFRDPRSPSPVWAPAWMKSGTFMLVLVPQAAYLFCIHLHKQPLKKGLNQFSSLLRESLNPWTTATLVLVRPPMPSPSRFILSYKVGQLLPPLRGEMWVWTLWLCSCWKEIGLQIQDRACFCKSQAPTDKALKRPGCRRGSCSRLGGALASSSSVFSRLIPSTHSDAGVHFVW